MNFINKILLIQKCSEHYELSLQKKQYFRIEKNSNSSVKEIVRKEGL